MTTTKLETKRVALSVLQLDPDNARRHSKVNIRAIKGSLLEFGQVMPLVVEKGSNRVIGGNGTLRAMRSMGWPDAQIVEVDVHDARATALAVALNRTGELATWDEDQLAKLLKAQAGEFDLEAFGWDDDALKGLLGKKMEIPGDDEGDDDDEIVRAEGLRYRIIIDCVDESHQADILARLEQDGLKCQPLIS